MRRTCWRAGAAVDRQTRIGLITKITFAASTPRKEFLRGHFLTERRIAPSRFTRVEAAAPYWIHHFEIRSESDLDDEFRALAAESYRTGCG